MAKKKVKKLKCGIATSNHILNLYSIHDAIDILGKAGYDAIEIWAQRIDYDIKKRQTSITKIRSAIERQEMTGCIHAPLKNLLSKDWHKYNITSKNVKLRKESIDAVLRSLEYAKKLGFEVITVHPGHTDQEGETVDKEYWDLQIAAFKRFAKRAEQLGVKIGMEPMEHRPKEFVMEPKQVDRVINAVNSKNLGITFDLIHAYSHGVNKPIEFMDAHHKNIFHVHVSGHCKEKNHVPFSMTNINHLYLDKVLHKLVTKYRGLISIEGTTHNIKKQTKTHQKQTVKENLAYIHRELKALHPE